MWPSARWRAGRASAIAAAMRRTVFALLCLWSCLARVSAETPLLVSAAASLKDVLTELKRDFTDAHPEVVVTFNFGGSGLLRQQIEQGAPVDVLISAAPAQMDALEKNGRLLAGSRRDLLGNQLVLITPRDATLVRTFADLSKPEVQHIMVGDPKSAPAGAYAAETFAFFKLTASLEPKLVRALDVRQVLASVGTRNADAGIVYLTDAKISPRVRIAALAPAEAHSPIIYPLAIIQTTRAPEAARQFVDFLSSEAARAVFTRSGFTAIP